MAGCAAPTGSRLISTALAAACMRSPRLGASLSTTMAQLLSHAAPSWTGGCAMEEACGRETPPTAVQLTGKDKARASMGHTAARGLAPVARTSQREEELPNEHHAGAHEHPGRLPPPREGLRGWALFVSLRRRLAPPGQAA